ncbi:MAG TPA: hypothetical protein VD767_03575 [Thermomicrobiales bacterium]|nr:hypothetical protein [Thermomicrobiales bacterium]
MVRGGPHLSFGVAGPINRDRQPGDDRNHGQQHERDRQLLIPAQSVAIAIIPDSPSPAELPTIIAAGWKQDAFQKEP